MLLKHWAVAHFGEDAHMSNSIDDTLEVKESLGKSILAVTRHGHEYELGEIPSHLEVVTIKSLSYGGFPDGQEKIEGGRYIGSAEDIQELKTLQSDLQENLKHAVADINDFLKNKECFDGDQGVIS